MRGEGDRRTGGGARDGQEREDRAAVWLLPSSCLEDALRKPPELQTRRPTLRRNTSDRLHVPR